MNYIKNPLPILDLYDVEKEIQHALECKVELKSCGYLIIDKTEAMTTIDINTGAFIGHRNLEETIFNTNIEAVTSYSETVKATQFVAVLLSILLICLILSIVVMFWHRWNNSY